MTKLLPRWITDGAHELAKRSAQLFVPPGNGSPTHTQFARSFDAIVWRSTNPAPVAYAYQMELPLARNTNGSGKSSACRPLLVETTTEFAAAPPGAGPGGGGGGVVVVVEVVVVVGDVVVVVGEVVVVVVEVVEVVEVVVVEVVVVVVFGGFRPLAVEDIVVVVDLGVRCLARAPASAPGSSVTHAVTTATNAAKSATARAPRAERFGPRSAFSGAPI